MKKSLCLLIMAAMLAGCSNVNTATMANSQIPFEKTSPQDNQVEALEEALKSPITELGYQSMIHQLKVDDKKNIMISPISLSVVLSMLQNGADQETKKEIVALLGEETTSNVYYNQLLNYLNDKNSESLSINLANSYWMNDKVKPGQSFIDTLKSNYDADVYSIDVSNPKTADTINAWIEEKTNGKVKKTVDQLSDEVLSILINTIYFKGSWEEGFEEGSTVIGDFYVNDMVKQMPLMFQSTDMIYEKGSDYQYAKLDYSEGMSFGILLPDEDVEDWLNNHTAKEFEAIFLDDNLMYESVDLTLPKFEFEQKIDLKTLLTSMGMEKAFDKEEAQFPYITEGGEQVWVDKVYQNMMISVDESGTEAAAATVAEMKFTTAFEPNMPIELKCDRPFVFAIIEDETGLPLFMGVYKGAEIE